ncbi:MAG TPA: hypothetical protein PLK77_18405 [Pyrinomonadaceae bacterium]|nr:hypothetical protein [Pyrinomonadaceae bacterium]
MSLEDAAANGHIQPHKTSADEVRSLRALVDRDVADSKVELLSDDRRFATAYNAALQISKLALACAGYRVSKGQSAHFASFEMVAIAIPANEIKELTDYFDVCRRKRNHIDYDGSQIVSRGETEELIKKVQEYRSIIDDWIKATHPNLS